MTTEPKRILEFEDESDEQDVGEQLQPGVRSVSISTLRCFHSFDVAIGAGYL
jgi:hypothetical protein